MTPHNAAVEETGGEPASRLADDSGCVSIDTRFGTMQFNRENAVYMPRGLLGYAENRDFGICSLSGAGLDQFMLLQSMTEPALSFVVAPLNRDGETISEDDIESACSALGIEMDNAGILLVVSTRRIGTVAQISVNLRAPIIIDAKAQTGWQHVLLNNRYPVREVIGEIPHEAPEA